MIADLVGSKRIKNRFYFQKELLDILNAQSLKSKDCLVAPFTVTLGDEFQALYNKADSIFIDFWNIRDVIYPEDCRFAYAFGGISTEINNQQTIGMDGPCFHRARELIGKLKKKKITTMNFYSDNQLNIDFLNVSLELIFSFTQNWKQNSIMIMTKLMEGYSIDEIAHSLSMTKRGVYRNISGNHINEVYNFQKIAIKKLNFLWKIK